MSTALRTYFRGHTLATMRDEVAGVNRNYYFDHQGTTQCLTDDTGAVTDRFACDAWGVQVKRTGSSINRHWYIGNLGYHRDSSHRDYVRARHLDVVRADWLSRDQDAPRIPPYLYVSGGPARHVDLSGHGESGLCESPSVRLSAAGRPSIPRCSSQVSTLVKSLIRDGIYSKEQHRRGQFFEWFLRAMCGGTRICCIGFGKLTQRSSIRLEVDYRYQDQFGICDTGLFLVQTSWETRRHKRYVFRERCRSARACTFTVPCDFSLLANWCRLDEHSPTFQSSVGSFRIRRVIEAGPGTPTIEGLCVRHCVSDPGTPEASPQNCRCKSGDTAMSRGVQTSEDEGPQEEL